MGNSTDRCVTALPTRSNNFERALTVSRNFLRLPGGCLPPPGPSAGVVAPRGAAGTRVWSRLA
eukprot:5624943-Alexandrium_andersonii.AAC.1